MREDITIEELIQFFINDNIKVAIADEEGVYQVKKEMPSCKNCGKRADELQEYIESANESDMEIVDYVREREGTYNPFTNKFYCTDCYIELGMPLGKA